MHKPPEGGWIGWFCEKKGRCHTREGLPRCAVYNCTAVHGVGGEELIGGHVLVKEHPSRQHYFIAPLCASHNTGGEGTGTGIRICAPDQGKGKRHDGGGLFGKTKTGIRPVALAWSPDVEWHE